MARGKKRKAFVDPALAEMLQDAEAFAEVVRSPAGQRMMRYIHRKVNSRSTFVPGDPSAMCIREGMRVLYLHIHWLAALAAEDIRKRYQTLKEQSVWEQTRDVQLDELNEGDFQ